MHPVKWFVHSLKHWIAYRRRCTSTRTDHTRATRLPVLTSVGYGRLAGVAERWTVKIWTRVWSVILCLPCMTVSSSYVYNNQKCIYNKAQFNLNKTRSQAIARIANRAASQHLRGLYDVLGHVTIWKPICHFLLVVLWNGVSVSPAVFEIFETCLQDHVRQESLANAK